MALKKKKKKKRKFGAASAFSGGSSRGREQSPLRPLHEEKTPPCSNVCPSGNRIREFLTTIGQAERLSKPLDQAMEEAWYIYTDTSPFPAVCGRVCPHPCETECNRTELEGAININKVERGIGDFGLEKDLKLKMLSEDKHEEKVAVIGAGPGGLSCAYQLARRGYPVTVFESSDNTGGMLRWGIPRYRLPASLLDNEVKKITDLGVEIKFNTCVGKDISLDDLRSQYKAVFVSIGAHTGRLLRVEGEDAENVISGVEFLNRHHHGEKVEVGSSVIVVGGGDTAIDAARISKRLGADSTILYRRTQAEMPATEEEIEQALEEGIKIEFLAAPVGFNKEGNRITSMKCIRMELGEPDDSGRRRPVPIEGSEFELEATTVIPAISQSPDFTGFESLVEGPNWFQVDDNNACVGQENIYAGGDAVNLDLVTTAIGHGRFAAEAIDHNLRNTPNEKETELPVVSYKTMRLDHYDKMERKTSVSAPVEKRLAEMDAEVNLGFSGDEVVVEANRCMSCGHCFDCEKCWMFCQDQAIEKPMEKGKIYSFKLENCTGCKKCAEECPCNYIIMQ